MEQVVVEEARVFPSNESMREFYAAHGWISVRNAVSRSLLEEVVGEIEFILNPEGRFPSLDSALVQLDSTDKALLYDRHMGANKLWSLRRVNDEFSRMVKVLNGTSTPVFEISIGFLLGLPQDSRLAYDFHQESNFMKGFGDISNFHFPLRLTSTVENGTMSVLDKSHLLGTRPYLKSRASEDSFTDLVPEDIQSIRRSHQEIFCHLEPGDVTVFHKDCIHRSNFNRSDKCRLVGVSRLTQDYNYGFRPQSSSEL